MQTNFTRWIFAAGAAATVVGLSACAYAGPATTRCVPVREAPADAAGRDEHAARP